MTREEFEDWLEERKQDALDDMPQSDTTKQKWLARLYAALKLVADQEDSEEPEEDEIDSDEEDDEVEESTDEEDEG
jgi:hypothetical protein